MSESLRYSRVSGHVASSPRVIYIGANGNRVRVEVAPNYSGYLYANIYLDSVASGQLVGSVGSFTFSRWQTDSRDDGDLPQRRLAINVIAGNAGNVVGITEVFESRTSGG